MKNPEENEGWIYALIIDDLEQTISEEQKAILDEWRKSSAANELVYNEFLGIQQGMEKLGARNLYNPDLSWQRLEGKLGQQRRLDGSGRRFRLNWWYTAAASIIAVLGCWYYLFEFREPYVTLSTAETAEVKSLVLADGTEVSLNGGTTIRYREKDFEKARRLILIQGEVFVHVVNHKGQPFKVDLGQVEARDIGTRFNVIRNDRQAEVTVEEGEVALRRLDKQDSVLLQAGMSGQFDESTRQITSGGLKDPNYKAWVDKKLSFLEVPVEEVARQLFKVYKVPLDIQGRQLKSRKLSANFHYQTLDSVLAVISASLQCKVIKEQNKYVLSAD